VVSSQECDGFISVQIYGFHTAM